MKRLFCSVLLLLLLPLGGCLQGLPLDKYCYVLDLGVERGETLPYRFVFLLNEDTAGEEGEEGGRGQVSMIWAEERTLFSAVEALSGALPAQLSFERTTLLAFSRELAESGEMDTLTEGVLGRLKIRQNVRMLVIEEDMRATFQGLVSPADPSMSRLKTNVKLYAEGHGYVEDWGLSEMREAFRFRVGDALLPYAALVDGGPRADMAGGQVYPYVGGGLLGEGQLKTSLCGSAVFAGDRMVGVLSGQHTMLVLMAKGTFQEGHLTLPQEDGGPLEMALYAVKPPKRTWEPGRFTCRLTLEADMEDPLQIEMDEKELIRRIETYLSKELTRVFRATADAGADVFCLGREAIRDYATWTAWQAARFPQRLGEVEALFQVRVKLSHSPRDPALE